MRYGGQVHTMRDRPEGELPFAGTKPMLLNLSLWCPCARALGLPSLVLTKVSYSLEDVRKIPEGTTHIGSPLWNHLAWRPPRRILWPQRSHGHAVSPLFLSHWSLSRPYGRKVPLWGGTVSLSHAREMKAHSSNGALGSAFRSWRSQSQAGSHQRRGAQIVTRAANGPRGTRLPNPHPVGPEGTSPQVATGGFNQTLVARASHLLIHSKRKH